MFTLIAIVFFAIAISFLCSVFEAVLLSVTPSYISALAEENPDAAARLNIQKENVESPLVAILTLNTISHTVGAAVAGAQAAKVFGDDMLGVFSGVLTFLILFFSEIIPKTIGANQWRQLAPAVSYVLLWLERATKPLIWMSQQVTKTMSESTPEPFVRQEISAMAKMGHESGELDEQESKIVTQMLSAKDVPVTAIMTPRTVIFNLPASMKVEEFVKLHSDKPFTRIPLFQKNNEDIIGYVDRSDIILANYQTPQAQLVKFKRDLLVIPSSARILPLFELMIRRNTQIAVSVDEYGDILGVVTQEDIIESLLGLEIVDLNDPAIDMQQLARSQWEKRMKEKGIVFSADMGHEEARTSVAKDEADESEGEVSTALNKEQSDTSK